MKKSLRCRALGLSSALGCGALIASACNPAGGDPHEEEARAVSLDGTPFPCDVARVLVDKCWECHGPTPKGSPMALAWWEDITKASQTRSGQGKAVAQLIADRVNSPNSPMPPHNAHQGPLTQEERATLNAWLGRNAPPGDGTSLACQPREILPAAGGAPNGGGGYDPGGGSGPMGGASPGGGAPPAGGSGSPGIGGAPGVGGGGPPSALPDAGPPIVVPDLEPVSPEPGECNVIQVRARADASGAPYQVPANYIDRYICFEFTLDFAGTPTQALQFKSAVQHDFVHHWLLYRKKPGVVAANGANAECLGVHPDAELMAGWAPGAGDWNMPKTVGMDMGSGHFMLELHYNNAGAASPDASGVDVCITNNLRPKTAGISWLGTEQLFLPPQAEAHTGSYCKPANQTEPIYVMRSWPHMHMMGRSMQADILRADGTVEPLFNAPFDFNNQWQYDTPAILHPGDQIKTTCHFTNTSPGLILFGERTTEEMCYNFVVSYPAGALKSFPEGIHSNSCMAGAF